MTRERKCSADSDTMTIFGTCGDLSPRHERRISQEEKQRAIMSRSGFLRRIDPDNAKDLPVKARPIVEAWSTQCAHVRAALTQMFPTRLLFLGTVASGKIHAGHCYKNDGRTPTEAEDYHIYRWYRLHERALSEPEGSTDIWNCSSSTEGLVICSLEFEHRLSDGRVEPKTATLYVSTFGDKPMKRVTYTNSGRLYLKVDDFLESAQLIQSVLDREDLRSAADAAFAAYKAAEK